MKRTKATIQPAQVRLLYQGSYLRISELSRDATGRIINIRLDYAERAAASTVDPYTAAEIADAYETGIGSLITTEIA